MIPADPHLRIVAAFLAVLALSQLTVLPVAALACGGALFVTALSPDGLPWRRRAHLEAFV